MYLIMILFKHCSKSIELKVIKTVTRVQNTIFTISIPAPQRINPDVSDKLSKIVTNISNLLGQSAINFITTFLLS